MRFDFKFPMFLAIALLGAMALIACAPDAAAPVALMATMPAAYVHQEYPKWVGEVLVHNEAEEIAQLERLNPEQKVASNEEIGEDAQDGYATLALPTTDPQPTAGSGQQGKRRR